MTAGQPAETTEPGTLPQEPEPPEYGTGLDGSDGSDGSDDPDGSDGAGGSVGSGHTGEPARAGSVDNADGMAVASFVAGLTGLLVCNVVLGPCALVLGGLALARRTTRRGRAVLGMVLGVADLVVLAVLVTINGTVSWSVGA